MKQLIDMAARTLRIATRKSPLALWQANFVKDRLEALYPDLRVELVPMSTQGDKILDTPLAKVGGKGLFVKELETAMLEGRADIAVHSMKDVPVEFPEGLGLHTICEREDPRDAFVSNRFDRIDALPQGAVVGTSSLRRQCQLRAARPDLVIRDLRGSEKMPGHERIWLPGEQSHEKRIAYARDGIPIPPALAAALDKLAGVAGTLRSRVLF